MIDSYLFPDFVLNDQDFPRDYIQMRHVDDYKIVSEFTNSFTVSSRQGRTRLIARLGWSTPNGYIPMSFVCNTGAPSSFTLSQEATDVLEEFKILQLDDCGEPFVQVYSNRRDSFNARVNDTPQCHKHANILGLKVLMKLGLTLNGESFSFGSDFESF